MKLIAGILLLLMMGCATTKQVQELNVKFDLLTVKVDSLSKIIYKQYKPFNW